MVIAEHKESKELDLEKAIEDLQIPEIQNAKKKLHVKSVHFVIVLHIQLHIQYYI